MYFDELKVRLKCCYLIDLYDAPMVLFLDSWMIRRCMILDILRNLAYIFLPLFLLLLLFRLVLNIYLIILAVVMIIVNVMVV